LQAELAAQSRGYEAKVSELEQESRQKGAWAVETERRLSKDLGDKCEDLRDKCEELRDKCEELGRAVDALHAVERTLEERTHWAQDLDRELSEIKSTLNLLRSSRWVRFGKALGVGPRLRED
jgi:predicted RNase H-like nuclease (RuvC/YqgF family)